MPPKSLAVSIFLLLVPSVLLAQGRFESTVDSSYTLQTMGPAYKFKGRDLYQIVAVHKMIEHEGRVFACVGVASTVNLHSKFGTRSQIRGADGRKLKRGLRNWSDFSKLDGFGVDITPHFTIRQNGRDVKVFRPQTILYRAKFSQLLGTPVNCMATRIKPEDTSWKSGTTLHFPDQVSYTTYSP